jgi:hypothetical protein
MTFWLRIFSCDANYWHSSWSILVTFKQINKQNVRIIIRLLDGYSAKG